MEKAKYDPHVLEEKRAWASLHPSPWSKRETRRRRELLSQYRELRMAGMSQVAASKKLRTSVVTIWRWLRRVQPDTFLCGRRSPFEEAHVPVAVLDRVEVLQFKGLTNRAAWRAVAAEEICPPVLAEFLRQARNIPPSFLKATSLLRYTAMVKVVSGRKIVAMQRYDAKF